MSMSDSVMTLTTVPCGSRLRLSMALFRLPNSATIVFTSAVGSKGRRTAEKFRIEALLRQDKATFCLAFLHLM